MELRHLRYFVAIAEEKGFGRAARRLRVAQQALSRQIADLEREVGAALFYRVHAGALLTPAGEEFLAGTRRVLETAERTAEQARRAAAGRVRVRVGCPDVGSGVGVLRDALGAFRTRRPDVAVAFDFTPATTHADRVRDGSLDVGFVLTVRWSAEPGDTGKAASESPLAAADCRRACVAVDALDALLLPATSRDADATSVGSGGRRPEAEAEAEAAIDFAALSALPLLFPRSATPPSVHEALEPLRRRGWRGATEFVAGTTSTLTALVAAGAGWMLVPRSARAWTEPGTAVRGLPDGEVGCLETHALWRPDDATSAALVETLAEHARWQAPCAAA